MLYFLSGRGTSLQNCVFKVTRKRSEKSQVFLRQNCLGLKIYAWKRTRNKKVKKKRYCKSFGGKFSWLKILQFHKGPKRSQKKISKSFGGKIFLSWRYCALKRDQKKSEKNLSFCGKIVLRKKKSALLNGVMFWVKNILSLLAGKILPCATNLSHQNSKYVFDFWLDSVQKCRIFFLFGNPT